MIKKVIIVCLLAVITCVMTLPYTSCKSKAPDTEIPVDTTSVDTTVVDTVK